MSLERGLDILGIFGIQLHAEFLRPSERDAGDPENILFCILKSLESKGYVQL